jgi:2-haloacid dehalogenase
MIDPASFDILTFDCYGTLIDWERGIADALTPILAAHGVRLSEDALLEQYAEIEAGLEHGPYLRYRELLGQIVVAFGDRHGFAPTEAEVTALPESVKDWPAFPDTAAALQALAGRYDLVILSNIDDDLFAGSLPRLGVSFRDVITAQQAGSYKPNPRHFHLAFERLGVGPERILHIAQSLFHDIAPAKALGLSTVWVNRRHGRNGSGATPPASAAPDVEVPDMASVATLLSAR